MRNSLMTFEEYAQTEHATPYIFELSKGSKRLLYLGVSHAYDPKDILFPMLKDRITAFSPEMIFVEGISDFVQNKEFLFLQLEKMSEEDAIQKMGEVGFVLKLGMDLRVQMDSPEPKPEDTIHSLLSAGFSQEEIFAHEIYLVVDQYYRQQNGTLESFVTPYISSFRKLTHWSDFEYSLEHAQQIGEKIWGKEKADFTNATFASIRIDPTPWDEIQDEFTVINKISQETSYFRDTCIVENITQRLGVIDRLCVVFGSSHAFMQERALRELFK